jgi:hypothetical protein
MITEAERIAELERQLRDARSLQREYFEGFKAAGEREEEYLRLMEGVPETLLAWVLISADRLGDEHPNVMRARAKAIAIRDVLKRYPPMPKDADHD